MGTIIAALFTGFFNWLFGRKEKTGDEVTTANDEATLKEVANAENIRSDTNLPDSLLLRPDEPTHNLD